MSLSNNYPTTAPSLSLDFANTGKLDPRITFSRASTATYYDGVTTAMAEQNLLTYSQEFDNVAWSQDDITITANSTTAPDGTTTADTIVDTVTNSDHRLLVAVNFNFTSGVTYTTSIFAKNNTLGFIQIAFGSAAFGATAYANFDLSTGVLGTVGAGTTAVITSVGSGWYRCSITATATTSTTTAPFFGLITSATSVRSEIYAGTGKSIYLWGAQLEQRSTVTAYTATTTAPITNYIPVLMTAASNVARFDHTPTTGSALGLLIEESRTNLMTYSSQFDNAAWTQANATITANTIVAPDGTLTADKFVENTTATVSHELSQAISGLTAIIYTYSVIAKAAGRGVLQLTFSGNGGSAFANYDLANGVLGTVGNSGVATITSVGNGWYRCTLASGSAFTAGSCNFVMMLQQSTTAGRYGAYTGDGYSGIYIWGAQLEAGAFATSYIPTVASQVTRIADIAVMTGANFSSWFNASEGTLSGVIKIISTSSNGPVAFGFSDGTANNLLYGGQTIPGTVRPIYIRSSATDQAITTVSATITSGYEYTFAGAYQFNDAQGSSNNTLSTVDNSVILPINLNTATIGGGLAGIQMLTGYIKKLSYYPKRLTSTQLQALTS